MPESMKVTHVVLSLDCGGLERVVLDLVREGRRLGQQVTGHHFFAFTLLRCSMSSAVESPEFLDDSTRPQPPLVRGAIEQIITFSDPYDYYHDRYQAYYGEALRNNMLETGGRFDRRSLVAWPNVVCGLRRVRYSSRLSGFGRIGRLFQRGADRLAAALHRSERPPAGMFHPLVGQYLFRLADGSERKVCIDSQDSGDLLSEPLLAWCDLYLKTNYWPSRTYPNKVKPLCNANPRLLGKFPQLHALRRIKPEYDVCFIVRVWGGKEETEGIEHNLRLLEAVARVRCRKYLLAYLVAGDVASYIRRLESQGISWTRKFMPLHQLWDLSARSRLNIIRLGMHACVPWRMMDLLAMGACPVLDQRPYTLWQQPLLEGENYLSLDVAVPPDQCLGRPQDYVAVTERVEAMVADAARTQHIQEKNAQYFDAYLTPEALGRHLCAAVLESRSEH
jgi:hypothetical protein